mmetsp:Transcript_36951/g.111678  ORF Transcript_36951/g.111678 Transcript_36951/m.111678 type:complete len:434 (-) Transcript_36951:107-1408(-)
MPLRLRMLSTSACALLPSWRQSPGSVAQWSNAVCGKARPLVACRSAAAKPKDSATGRCAFICRMGVPSQGLSSKTTPRRNCMQECTPPAASCGQLMSTKKTGSCSAGRAVSSAAKKHRRAVCTICPSPRWTRSACRRASTRLKRTPRMLSPHNGPSFAAPWKPPITCSFASLRYGTATVSSTSTFAPSMSGPKHQSFRAALSSHSNCSRSNLARSFASALGPAGPSSIAAHSSSAMGAAATRRRLSLFTDFAKHVALEALTTVSRYVTTGSDTVKSHWANTSRKSRKHVSKCISPQPAMVFSPVSSCRHSTSWSDLASFCKPSTSFGKSKRSLTLTATFTTGETLYFMSVKLCASSRSVSVPDFTKYWSTPARATVLPQGTSATCSVARPISSTVCVMFRTCRSVLDPGAYWGPWTRTRWPRLTVPLKTRPKA